MLEDPDRLYEQTPATSGFCLYAGNGPTRPACSKTGVRGYGDDNDLRRAPRRRRRDVRRAERAGRRRRSPRRARGQVLSAAPTTRNTAGRDARACTRSAARYARRSAACSTATTRAARGPRRRRGRPGSWAAAGAGSSARSTSRCGARLAVGPASPRRPARLARQPLGRRLAVWGRPAWPRLRGRTVVAYRRAGGAHRRDRARVGPLKVNLAAREDCAADIAAVPRGPRRAGPARASRSPTRPVSRALVVLGRPWSTTKLSLRARQCRDRGGARGSSLHDRRGVPPARRRRAAALPRDPRARLRHAAEPPSRRATRCASPSVATGASCSSTGAAWPCPCSGSGASQATLRHAGGVSRAGLARHRLRAAPHQVMATTACRVVCT